MKSVQASLFLNAWKKKTGKRKKEENVKEISSGS